MELQYLGGRVDRSRAPGGTAVWIDCPREKRRGEGKDTFRCLQTQTLFVEHKHTQNALTYKQGGVGEEKDSFI